MLPGPGFYDVKNFILPTDKKAVSSSMFKSDSVRELMLLKRGPGPAFYYKNAQPVAENKKLFNFNPSKQWL
jgi:hypothetical protein